MAISAEKAYVTVSIEEAAKEGKFQGSALKWLRLRADQGVMQFGRLSFFALKCSYKTHFCANGKFNVRV